MIMTRKRQSSKPQFQDKRKRQQSLVLSLSVLRLNNHRHNLVFINLSRDHLSRADLHNRISAKAETNAEAKRRIRKKHPRLTRDLAINHRLSPRKELKKSWIRLLGSIMNVGCTMLMLTSILKAMDMENTLATAVNMVNTGMVTTVRRSMAIGTKSSM